MTHDERWLAKYEEAMSFLKENHRKPSHFILKEHHLRSWRKNIKKRLNAEEFNPQRAELFKELLALSEMNKYHS